MRERIPLLVPLACALGSWLFPAYAQLFLAALASSVATLMLAAPVLFREVSPIPLPSFSLSRRWTARRVAWWAVVGLCVTAGASLFGSFFALALVPSETEFWTSVMMIGMLSLVVLAPLGVFVKPSPPSAAAEQQRRDAASETGGPERRPQRDRAGPRREPSDFIPEPLRSTEESPNGDSDAQPQQTEDERIEEFRSLWSFTEKTSGDAEKSTQEMPSASPSSASAPSPTPTGTPSGTNGSPPSSGSRPNRESAPAEDASPPTGNRPTGASASSSASASRSAATDASDSASSDTGEWDPDEWPDFNYDL